MKVPYNGLDNDDYAGGTSFCNSCRKSNAESSRLNANGNAELLQYYYHPDHLGSSSFITDLDGNIAQHVEYVPFGEVFLEEHNNTWQTPYLFNGKELDEETGLYYYGARYYDPKVSQWLSVDPLAEKYPSISPYAYVANNPINAIDPDGKDIIILGDSKAVNGLGHAAVLVGNDKDGWRYYSMNGTGEGAKPIGGSRNADLGNIKYNKKTGLGNDFRGTGLTASEVMKIVNTSNPKENDHNYDRALEISSSATEDTAIAEASQKQASVAGYSVLGSSCIDVPQVALEKLVETRYKKYIMYDDNYKNLSERVGDLLNFESLIPNEWMTQLYGLEVKNAEGKVVQKTSGTLDGANKEIQQKSKDYKGCVPKLKYSKIR